MIGWLPPHIFLFQIDLSLLNFVVLIDGCLSPPMYKGCALLCLLK